MQIQDDRTEEQKSTHQILIGGTDKFLSGWGKAQGGKSYAFWACPNTWGELRDCERWVRSRPDIIRVRTVLSESYRPKGVGHCHIYVYNSSIHKG